MIESRWDLLPHCVQPECVSWTQPEPWSGPVACTSVLEREWEGKLKREWESTFALLHKRTVFGQKPDIYKVFREMFTWIMWLVMPLAPKSCPCSLVSSNLKAIIFHDFTRVHFSQRRICTFLPIFANICWHLKENLLDLFSMFVKFLRVEFYSWDSLVFWCTCSYSFGLQKLDFVLMGKVYPRRLCCLARCGFGNQRLISSRFFLFVWNFFFSSSREKRIFMCPTSTEIKLLWKFPWNCRWKGPWLNKQKQKELLR